MAVFQVFKTVKKIKCPDVSEDGTAFIFSHSEDEGSMLLRNIGIF